MNAVVETGLHACEAPDAAPTAATWLQVLTDIHPRYGGVSAAVPELSRALRWSGLDAPIAALCRADEQTVPWQTEPDQIHFFPRARGAWLPGGRHDADMRELMRFCDGAHVHGLWTAASHVALRAARYAGKPLCVAAHGMLEPWSLRQHRFRKQCYAALIEHRVLRGAACLHALTRSEAESYRAITRDVPVIVVPNGVEVPGDVAAAHFFAIYPELRDRRIVLFLSRLHPKKAADVLLRAWPRVQAECPDAHLVIAGAGEPGYELALHALAAAQCARGSVTFTGMLQGRLKWAALCAAECFVLPSHSEGFSVAILEALGSGTPVIATPQCNMPEIETGQCGWLTEPRKDVLSDVLRSVLSQTRSMNAQAGQRGRDLVLRRYAWSAIARQMAEVYLWLGGASLPASVEVLQ
ncbi:glycosyltransferase [Terriglobus aquaticus]|uniref:Glycosyltransferase n=1 Tax=Terriglobus aquaticus TaxID=940139 RepID=A0ABW9KGF8_9BACT|nr:glycosyltransferase [Terriglobus aquaticus]